MYKARSASYQRGMGMNDDGPLTEAERAKFKKTKISQQELEHFSFGERTREVMLDELEPILRGYAKNGFRLPKDVARLLNRAGMKTACGERWTPQLAWFLQGFLFERREKRRAAAVDVASRPLPQRPSSPGSSGQAPLSREELARRLSSLGRIAR